MSTTQALKVFENKRIRTFWDDQDEKWLFCINDIIEALTESRDPADYFKTRRKRDDTVAEGYQSIEDVVVRLLYLFHCSAVKQLKFYGKLRYIYCILT